MKKSIALSLALALIATVHANKHEFHHPQQFLKKLSDNKDKGQKVYSQFCVMCHAKKPAINLGAPRIGVKSEWQPRLKKGIDKMIAVIDPGLNAMPPRGGCFECSDDDLKQAILYMLPKEKQ